MLVTRQSWHVHRALLVQLCKLFPIVAHAQALMLRIPCCFLLACGHVSPYRSGGDKTSACFLKLRASVSRRFSMCWKPTNDSSWAAASEVLAMFFNRLPPATASSGWANLRACSHKQNVLLSVASFWAWSGLSCSTTSMFHESTAIRVRPVRSASLLVSSFCWDVSIFTLKLVRCGTLGETFPECCHFASLRLSTICCTLRALSTTSHDAK